MGQRLDLQRELNKCMENAGCEPHVYFQPPEGLKMTFPCIVYGRSNMNIEYADGYPYNYAWRDTVTVIDRNPESRIVSEVAKLPKMRHDRVFTSQNLYHTVFTIYE